MVYGNIVINTVILKSIHIYENRLFGKNKVEVEISKRIRQYRQERKL